MGLKCWTETETLDCVGNVGLSSRFSIIYAGKIVSLNYGHKQIIFYPRIAARVRGYSDKLLIVVVMFNCDHCVKARIVQIKIEKKK